MFYYSKAANATRARFDEYVRRMLNLGEEYARSNSGRVDILSLASGPGRDVIKVAEILKDKEITVNALCIDRCREAVLLGSALAQERGLQNITFRNCNITEIHRLENNAPYDVVITQGILDYLSNKKAVDLLANVRELSREGGTLITSNMRRHAWIRFWMEIFGEWRLRYREGSNLKNLLLTAGYDSGKIVTYLLPEGYHWMGIGKT